MPDFEFEFNQEDKDLIISQEQTSLAGLNYMRLTIYPTEAIDNIVDLPDDTKGVDGKAIFFSSTILEEFSVNIAPFLDSTNPTLGERNKQVGQGEGDFRIYKKELEVGIFNYYIKPNEIFNNFELPQGNYKIQIDSLYQEETNTPFVIKQVSTSRKEVRIKIIDQPLTDDSIIITDLTKVFNNNESEFLEEEDLQGNPLPNPDYKYQFKHILNIGTGDHIPIMNYQFDRVTDGRENQSIILKLYDALPTNVGNLSMVTIEREVLTTQTQDIFYFSDVPDVFFGDGLESDPQENWINPDGNDIGFQNYNELSGSVDDTILDGLISGSKYNYPNLNTDFRFFENHTFFGSAKKKLENFNKKIETIQSHYSEISSSLSISSSFDGDSTFIIQKRKNLFNKIKEEIKTFSPYERFLYYDGQNESTASAPGLGENYADSFPVTGETEGRKGDVKALGKHNGFGTEVYKHSSFKFSGNHRKFIDIFTDKYQVHNKPFFNYSGSIYLSFLLQGDSGSILTNGNEQHIVLGSTVGGFPAKLPRDSKFQRTIISPDIIGNKHQRFIFETSHSYFIPKTTNNDMAEVTNFEAGSDQITILNGSIKTGSYKIKDTNNIYPTTVITQSGVPFFGSVMPAGELFRIHYRNELSESLSGYWNIDEQTSGSLVTNAMLGDNSGNKNTGSIEGTPTISDGYISGKSFLFQSESNEGVRFFSDDDFNYNRDDNFSLSVWAKRFHPNTGSADPSAGTGAQPIFTRGVQENSYGIDYDFIGNRVRAGVRPDGSNIFIQHTLADDLLEWHHLVFTFESGSSTGMKLYVDGDLKGTSTTTGTGYRITGSNAFSSSVATIGLESNVLSIGGNNVLGGSSRYYNGFIQYPRVYSRTITQAEVSQLYLTPDSITETKITDVKVTLNNPLNVLPFDNVYKTTSTEWIDWYNDLLTKAETFDTDNIHSLENNLPLYMQESSDYQDMKDFLNLQGEQYDLIRNHIDSLGTLHNRGYKKTNSPPDNTLPMLLNNMGWEAINPFEGNLTETLGNYLTGVTSIDDIKNNTWRKTLNNLLYIYKSKGTKNSVRGLLNIYGYPPDVLQFQEFGGSTQNQMGEGLGNDDIIFDDTPPNPESGSGFDLSLDIQTGSFSFTTKKQKLYRYILGGNSKRILNLDWWMDNANVNSLEFIYKHVNTTNTQTILNSSGSGALKATGSIQVLSGITSDFDGKTIVISSSDGTGKTYIFDDDNDGITGTLDGSGRVRIQISGKTQRDEIASEISTSISHINGHFGKIDVVDSSQFFTSNGSSFTTSDGDTLFANSSGSVFLTQITRSVHGNKSITTNAPSMSVSGFLHGSDKQTLWDLRLVPSTTGVSSSFEFRLSNTSHASASITASNALSMSTNYVKMTDGQLWNVMVQRITSSVSGSGTNEYRLHTALQEGKSIKTYNYVTMSVSGGLSNDSNYFANQNWLSSGSRHPLSSSNLFVGETHSGSLSQIRGWATALSTSKFRQHVLNKFSTVGNTLTSHKDELVYHFKLNENYSSSSISSSNQNLKIVDSAPTTTYLDYSFTKPGTTFNTSSVYGFDLIEVVKLTLQDNAFKANDNNIIINPRRNIVGNLSPIQSAVKPLTMENSKPLFKTSTKLELYRSPQTFVDNFILDNLSGFNFETLYGNPLNYYSQSYGEFDTFRENFFDAYPITVDTNKFIRAHENMFNHSIVEAVKSIVPARSTFSDRNSNFGVEIRPTILEKQKYENEEHSIEANPNTVTGSLDILSVKKTILSSSGTRKRFDNTTGINLTNSKFVQPKSGSVSVNITNTATYELPYSQSISLGNAYVTSSGYLKDAPAKNHFQVPFLQPGGYVTTIENPYSASSISPLPSLSDSAIVLPKSGSIDYATIANKSFVNIHDSWGTGTNNTHFINYSGGKSSVTNDYNTYHIDTRFVFNAVGDNEYYSASMGKASTFDDDSRFYNRLMIDNDFHSNVTYESLINGTVGGQSGRMMGKTRYFITSSDGTITLPRNHVTKFSQPFKEQMINGAQNENPGILNVQYEDYSTASYYRVKVTGGENEIKVQSGPSNLDSNNKIIYG